MQKVETEFTVAKKTLLEAYELMQSAQKMAELYDENRQICKYVHSTSLGHQAIQLAVGMQLKTCDFASPYYRDESILLGMGFAPRDLMLQLLAKADDPFSGGRCYYSHPSSNSPDFPKIITQTSATGMQAIPATGVAQGLKYLESKDLLHGNGKSAVVCSLGDASLSEGEVSEAFQVASFRQLPILYLVQDNDWGISVHANESRNADAVEFAAGFKGLRCLSVDGADFEKSYHCIADALDYVRRERKPILVHAKVPLLGHHTSGIRRERYRKEEELLECESRNPLHLLHNRLLEMGISRQKLQAIARRGQKTAADDFEFAANASEPSVESLQLHEFAPSPVLRESGIRQPEGGRKLMMVEATLYAMDEILRTHPEAIFYGQDIGRRLGGVFREAATLAEKYGDDRVFNTGIREAYIIGSTAGMTAAGVKPIVEIQFGDYIWPGFNQLVTEVAKSCYLSMGKYPVQTLIRVPVGAYGGGGPYHSACIESALLCIRGIKVVFPSNAADMKGLMKAAFLDPNPVIMLEHKGLYWSKVKGTEAAKSIEPDEDYVIPLGKARITLAASPEEASLGNTVGVITYGMGIHWALNAAKKLPGCVEILDLRSLNPLDEEAVYACVKRHGKALVLTEEPVANSFAESLAGRIMQTCWQHLDAPIRVMGAQSTPAVPLNQGLEKAMLPNADKVMQELVDLLES